MTRTICLLALAACTDPAPAVEPTTHTITGSATLVVIDEAGGAIRFPIGLHDSLVVAQFPVDDGWDVREGTSAADGTFTIADAPYGDYWLEVHDVQTGQRQLLWTDATDPAFEERAVGRGDASAAGPGTTLTLGPIDGLDPVQDGDLVQLTSGNLGLIANLFGALQPGATTLETTRTWTGNPLISAALNDHVVLTQLRTTTDARTGIVYSSPIRSVTLDGIEQLDRQNTRVTGTFTAPPELMFDLAWSRSAFATAAADIRPGVGPVNGQLFAVNAEPGGTAYGVSPFAPGVLSIVSDLTGDNDVAEKLAIRNPYPASWLFANAVMSFPLTLPVPDVPGATLELSSAIQVKTPELPREGHPLTPLVTPPRAPQINGMDMFTTRDGVGTSPVLAWSPPTTGAPTAYVIFVERWDVQFGSASFAEEATLVVPGDVTSVRVPARILERGQHYVFRITALVYAEDDVRTHSLYTLGLPFGSAEVIGSTITP